MKMTLNSEDLLFLSLFNFQGLENLDDTNFGTFLNPVTLSDNRLCDDERKDDSDDDEDGWQDFNVEEDQRSDHEVVPVAPGPSDFSKAIMEGPKQPVMKNFPKTKYGDRFRSFTPKWYSKYSWLEYSIMGDAAYCFHCRFFGVNLSEKTFSEIGFKNWKRASEKNHGFRAHERSHDHLTSFTKWKCFQDLLKNKDEKTSVVSILNETHALLVKENRSYLRMLSRILLFTAVQGIAQRGHDENVDRINRGNFLELINLIAENNDFL